LKVVRDTGATDADAVGLLLQRNIGAAGVRASADDPITKK
jgi:hypothetical protein